MAARVPFWLKKNTKQIWLLIGPFPGLVQHWGHITKTVSSRVDIKKNSCWVRFNNTGKVKAFFVHVQERKTGGRETNAEAEASDRARTAARIIYRSEVANRFKIKWVRVRLPQLHPVSWV